MKTFFRSTNPSQKFNRGICLNRTKNCADYDSRGLKLATPLAGTATLRYWAMICYKGVSKTIELIPPMAYIRLREETSYFTH